MDETTTKALEARGSERGLSISELIAEMTATHAEAKIAAEELSELDRRWAAIEAGEGTVAHDVVTRWLETWGTPSFGPWKHQ